MDPESHAGKQVPGARRTRKKEKRNGRAFSQVPLGRRNIAFAARPRLPPPLSMALARTRLRLCHGAARQMVRRCRRQQVKLAPGCAPRESQSVVGVATAFDLAGQRCPGLLFRRAPLKGFNLDPWHSLPCPASANEGCRPVSPMRPSGFNYPLFARRLRFRELPIHLPLSLSLPSVPSVTFCVLAFRFPYVLLFHLAPASPALWSPKKAASVCRAKSRLLRLGVISSFVTWPAPSLVTGPWELVRPLRATR